MKPIELSVRCTREEYMDYAVQSGKKYLWTAAVGFVFAAASIVSGVCMQRVNTACLLWGFCGVLLLLLDPLILPLYRKGEAARRYDRSESLQGAISLRLDETTLYVRTVTDEASLPLTALTDIQFTPAVTALRFGDTLTVCIPKRALRDEEATALAAILAQFMKKGNEHL